MTRQLHGQGDEHRRLSQAEIAEVCGQALAEVPASARRVLVLVSDHTRHAPIGPFFRALLAGEPVSAAVRLGCAHGALLATTSGVTAMVTLEQVRAFADGGTAHLRR